MGASDHWYKHSVIYGLDIGTFLDTDGDGVGDFQGAIERLDYLCRLGVTCVWLLPFYPSPNRDNGYDISDHYGVEPRLGSPGVFVEFLREARERGIRVIVDLVMDHTSDQHPWFQDARTHPESRYRDYYIWTDEPPEDAGQPIVFEDPDATIWEYDEQAGAYYHHLFYPFEPDLNLDNPVVRREMHEIMGFWLQLGVSGFRVDAASHMEAKVEPDLPRSPHPLLRDLRRFASTRSGDAALLAEADVEPSELGAYFGSDDGSEMHLLFNFVLDNYLFLALARESAEPIGWALELLPPTPHDGQWANFLRNLDELDLERLSEAERQEVFEAFAPDPEMRIYGRGIRRRLAPMLQGDRRRMELAYSLLFSLPGSPVIVYGDEIGMGDDLSLEERNSVRTPMQWSDAKNAGFSSASEDELPHPVISGGEFGYERVNVEAQRRDPASFLNWMQRLIRTYKECPEIGMGESRVLETEDAAVLALRAEWRDQVLVTVHNLSAEARTVTLHTGAVEAGALEDLLAERDAVSVEEDRCRLRLEGYGYRWLRAGGRLL